MSSPQHERQIGIVVLTFTTAPVQGWGISETAGEKHGPGRIHPTLLQENGDPPGPQLL